MVVFQTSQDEATHQKPQRVNWSRPLSIILFIITSLIFLPLIYHFSVALQPVAKEAVKGELFILPTDLTKNKTIALTGDWYFFWKQLLTPEQIESSGTPAAFIKGTKGWQDKTDSNDYPAIGLATYHLNVHLQKKTHNLALHIPQIDSAYKMYLNSELLASGGVVEDSITTAKPGYNSTIVRIPNGLEFFSITIQVSNYHSNWAGLWTPVVIGDADDLHIHQRDKVALSMFILGALLITIIHSLIQFFLRPADNIPLIFACLCLLFFLRELTAQHIGYALSGIIGNFVLLNKLNFFSFYAGMPMALYFFHLSYPREFHPKFCSVVYIVCLIFSTFSLVFPTRYLGYSLATYQAIALSIMLYILWRTWIAKRQKRRGADVMLLVSLTTFLFAANDILFMNNLINTGEFFNLGIIFFIAGQSFVTNSRFDNFINKNLQLTEKLEERNNDLELMSGLLETKVAQRTRQLELANAELKNLANNDPLTKVLNRYGLQQHIQSTFERYRRSNTPFSILLLDFDYFKEINDTYGHDVGDEVLKVGATIIQNGIREQDKLARWGGEEFLVLLPDTKLQGAFDTGQKLREFINAKPFSKGLDLKVSVTGGVAEVNENDTFDTLFKRADDALYQGKEQGRNQICS